MEVKIVNKSGFMLPRYETAGASGLDLRSTETIVIYPNETKAIKTGIYLEIPYELEGQIRPRSGMAKNFAVHAILGTIDSDYRGEISVILLNDSSAPFKVLAGDRVAQLVFCPIVRPTLLEVTEIDTKTARGAKGFGSTGKN